MKILASACLWGTLTGLAAPGLQAAAFDHALFDGILRRHVDSQGFVDYDRLRRQDAAALAKYLQRLESADLKGLGEDDKLVFWINAYNAVMIQQILDNPGLQKVSERFDLFDVPVSVAGGRWSLNDMEHRIIRGKTNPKNRKGPVPGVTLRKLDPRIHFALVCAARDCPKLRNFAYTAANLEKTLQENAVHFANSPKHLSIWNGRLRVSSLMKWYGEDFDGLGGVPVYLASLTDPSKRPDEPEIDRLLKTKYRQADFDYDWTLNDVKTRP
jgi:hypothetical protein